MPRFRLTLAYDGTGLVGWQRQPSGTSVQALVEDVLAILDGQPVTVAGAGRTDAGVHALGQVASFSLTRMIEPATLVRALNFHLPLEVRAITAAIVAPEFHARFDARHKTYRYQVWTGGPLPPMLRAYAWFVPGPLDLTAMAAAARLLAGEHDFAAFQSLGTDVPDTVRTIITSHVRAVPPGSDTTGGPDAPGRGMTAALLDGLDAAAGQLVTYEVTGTGFLRHMVRAIAGTLVEIGLGRQPAEWMREVLDAKDRSRAGRNAPAQGLFLVKVTY